MKLYFLLIVNVCILSVCFTACEETYKESDVTFSCQYYDVDIHSDTLIIKIYDTDKNFIDSIQTDEEGKAVITLPTATEYYVNAYGYNGNMHYVEGNTNFYLDNSNPYESVSIPFKYANDPNK